MMSSAAPTVLELALWLVRPCMQQHCLPLRESMGRPWPFAAQQFHPRGEQCLQEYGWSLQLPRP
ncbi:hypothetical protein [Cupriavidus sp. CP313]